MPERVVRIHPGKVRHRHQPQSDNPAGYKDHSINAPCIISTLASFMFQFRTAAKFTPIQINTHIATVTNQIIKAKFPYETLF